MLSKREKNSLLLLKLSFGIIKEEKRLFLGTLLYVIFNFAIFISYSFAVYYLHGIHIWNIQSFETVGQISGLIQIMHLLVIFGLIFFCSIVTLICKFATIYSTIRFLDGHKIKILDGLVKSAEKRHEIAELSVVYTLDAMVLIMSIFNIIKSFLNSLKLKIKGQYSPKIKSNIMEILDVPLMSYDNLSLKDSIKESQILITSKFGPSAVQGFSLALFSFLAVAVFFIVYVFINTFLDLNWTKNLVVCSVLTFTLWSILSTAKDIFKSVMYNYCKNKPINGFEGQIEKFIKRNGF